MLKFFLKILITAVIFALAGCAAPGASDARKSDFPAAKGFVIIRVVTNSPAITQEYGLYNQWDSLYVHGADGINQKLVLASSESRRSTQIFSGFLPEGRYELSEIALMLKRADLKGRGLTFEVKSGQITNLGSIIYQPTGDQGYAVFRSDRDDGMLQLINDEYPFLKNSGLPKLTFDSASIEKKAILGEKSVTVISNSPMAGGVGTVTLAVMQAISSKMAATEALSAWQTTIAPNAQLNLARANTYALNSIRELPDGELIAASNLGQLLLRKPAGDWVNLNVGDARELTAVFARDRNKIIVGGEEGQLYITIDGGSTWKSVNFPNHAGLIVNIQEHLGELMVLSQEETEFVLRTIRDIDNGTWTELKRFETEGDNLIARHSNIQDIATIQEDKYIVTVPKNSVQIFDFNTRTWKIVRTDGWYRQIKSVEKNTLLSSVSRRVPPRISTDSGSNWSEIHDECTGIYSSVISIDFVNRKNGYMLCGAMGMFKGSVGLKTTNDGGETWKIVNQEFPILPSQLVVANNVMLYVDILNRVYVSKDRGSNWTLERVAH